MKIQSKKKPYYLVCSISWVKNLQSTSHLVYSSQAIENDEELSEHGGGAILIWSESELNIQDSEFTNNKGATGGAINSLSSQLTVENSTFINNDSTAGSAAYKKGHGGAISTSGASFDDGTNSGRIEISNSLFEGNRAAGEGGALFLFGNPSDEIIVENSTIVNNYVIEGFEEYSIGWKGRMYFIWW